MTSVTATSVIVTAVTSNEHHLVEPELLPRELMMEDFNADLVQRAYRNMMKRTTKNVGKRECWIFGGCLTTKDTTRGPKPRQSVQYRLRKHHINAHLCRRKHWMGISWQ